jgi:site-specific DNA-methyltransferase (adenine-specific)
MMQYQIICDDNVKALASMDPCSLDACITDPPYGMDIAGAGWDKNVPPVKTWESVYRVLKPGAFVLSFCNPEFYHRMAVNVEDAGFIPKDMIVWMVTTKMAKANRLKPAHEPIFVAQKPLDGTIENNVVKWGCGRINTETTRIPWEGPPPTGWTKGGATRRAFGSTVAKAADQKNETRDANPNGRYPSDIIGHFNEPDHQKYFYAPRATRKERGEYNDHPTPKPINLMRYLCRIYCPKGGTVLDPFMGSGSTGIGARQEGMVFIGIDQDPHYYEITKRRLHEHVVKEPHVEKLFEYEP